LAHATPKTTNRHSHNQTPTSIRFLRDSSVAFEVHTHPAIEGLFGNQVQAAPSTNDSAFTASGFNRGAFNFRGSIIQTANSTYLLVPTEDTLDDNFDSFAAFDIATAAFEAERSMEIDNATDTFSELGRIITQAEDELIVNDGLAAGANALSLGIFVGETGAQPDGSTLLRKIDFEERTNLEDETRRRGDIEIRQELKRISRFADDMRRGPESRAPGNTIRDLSGFRRDLRNFLRDPDISDETREAMHELLETVEMDIAEIEAAREQEVDG
jgi:hypothetical protein